MALAQTASAQFQRLQLLPAAEVEQLDSASAAHLENAQKFLAEKQWAEAVEAIRRVQEADAARLVKVELARPQPGFERFVPAAEFCQWRLASLAGSAPEALAHYRRLVDPLAETWFQEGSKSNDESLLRRVVEQAFASRWGDDALLKLGDLALARGEPALARAWWQQLGPSLATAPAPLGVYPDTDLDLAAVRARLVLASLAEGSRQRAQRELAELRSTSPQAEGQLGGRQGRYADLLQSLLEESAGWPPLRQSPEWTTLGGNQSRGKVATGDLDPAGQPLWTYKLPRLSADRELLGTGRLRTADDLKSILSYHPIVQGGKVFLRLDARGNSYVVALHLKTGKPLWQVDYRRGLEVQPSPAADEPWDVSDAHAGLQRHIGVARYTLTASGGKLFARMGSPLTIPRERPAPPLAKEQGFLTGLDLNTQGKPLEGFPIRPPSADWTFEDAPLVEGGTLFVVMRKLEGARTQLYLAAFDLPTTSAGAIDDREDDARPAGRLKWRTRICSAAALGSGEDQITHLLLTLAGGRLYLNTNGGAVAAVDAASGRVLWLLRYPRAEPDRSSAHWFRDLTPCLAWQDLVIVAPGDCDRIFAIDAATGQLAWVTQPGVAADAVHLLGAQDDVLLAGGDALYWLDVHTGRQLAQFPAGKLGGAEQAAAAPRGYGRGTIAGGHVWFPTRESIFVFDVQPTAADFGRQPRLVREIPLVPRGVTGGNLVIAEGILLIASGDKLTAFAQ